MHNDKKYLDRCLWYENFCNVIAKFNGISVSTYADISTKKKFEKALLQLNIRIKPIVYLDLCLAWIY